MTIPQGVAHVEAAIALAARAADRIGELEDLDDGWQADAVGKLSATCDLLRVTLDRFYLKTKVSLPFARRCQEEARAVDGLLEEGAAVAETGGQARLTAAIERLAQAARVLDERSLMQGMAIT